MQPSKTFLTLHFGENYGDTLFLWVACLINLSIYYFNYKDLSSPSFLLISLLIIFDQKETIGEDHLKSDPMAVPTSQIFGIFRS